MIDTNKPVVYGQAPPRMNQSRRFCYRCWVQMDGMDPVDRVKESDHSECPSPEDILAQAVIERQSHIGQRIGGRHSGEYEPGIREIRRPAFRRSYLTEDDMSENR